ncbi:MAG TPA: helix-turn-helix domain-containing protein [Ktedonobacteraceae bacterium]|nr:helix-turn-helix domain-containing protein [Ktedonobacteraceae bacterium]
MGEEQEYLSIPGHVPVKEAATMLGLSEERVLQHVRARHLPSRKVDGRYMIPLQAVEEFHRKPHGRVRTTPAPWRTYRAGAKVHTLQIEVQAYAGQEQALQEKLQATLQQQQHLFPGTMQRYISTDKDTPARITILLIWKDTELTDETLLQRDLDAFKAEFVQLLDWATARYITKQAIIYT